MNVVLKLVSAGALALAASVAEAQFVKRNEAIAVLPNGQKKVETPPLPSASLAPPCPADRAGCAGSGWRMVETVDGLRECTEIYARPGTCRPSTYGREKRSRLWIVKARGQWLQCPRPELGDKCMSAKALPISEVQ